MPKAKFKRKGAPVDVLLMLESRQVKQKKINVCEVVNNQSDEVSNGHNSEVGEVINHQGRSDGSILKLPEEMICMILEHLPGGQ